ncbi:GNAT family N-acetyltransferase [Micromonospora sp. CPCC 206060]|uniref:lipid II:glycine glycyltransferase FemX n=1 Tax=Micromonospora sp. CPCC 206060 TaxID=3122406 RepID=UPI002FEF893E
MNDDFTVVGCDDDPLDAECPDVYFTAGYGRATAAAQGGVWHRVDRTDLIMLPYVQRDVDGQAVDAISPYGYSGVYVHPDCSPTDLDRFWAAVVPHWRAQGLVSLFVRFSPLDPDSVRAVRGLDTVRLSRLSDTIAVGLDQGPAAVWDAMAGRSRTAVRKARNTGLTATVRPVGPSDLVPGAPFRRLYEQTMSRLDSSPFYFFPDAYYRQLATGLGKDLLMAEVRDPTGMVVAASLVMRHRDRAHYHLAGSDPQAARDGANNLLVWTILEWAAESGCVVVHLGGGVRADDGLFRFKESFGGRRSEWWSGAVVIDPDRYRSLVAARARELGRPVDDLAAVGYFPAYRFGRG